MKTHIISVVIFAFSLLGIREISAAQAPVLRHARVLELEKNLTTEAQNVLRDFAPGKPFSVTVRIDAIHRSTVTNGAKEKLPYFEASEEIKDEWDDPNQNDFDLLNRVNRINVTIMLPTNTEKEHLVDLKANLAARLALVDGRDLIEIQEKTWAHGEDYSSSQTSWILGIGFAFLVIIGLIYLSVSSFSLSRIVKAISNVKLNTGESSGGSVSGGPNNFSGASVANTSRSTGADFRSDRIQFNDSLKMTEVILNLVKTVESRPTFPSLDDMMLLEEGVKNCPDAVSGLLAEFPLSIRKKIFSLSSSETWLEALTKKGEINQNSFDLANRLVKTEKENTFPEWEELLILSWRLNQKLPALLKKVPSKDALTILEHLPRSIAIRAAREAMPGEWAVVLKNNTNTKITMDIAAIAKYKNEALQLMPLRPTDSLERYKREMDLMDYLLTCDPAVEKEVYGALPSDSLLQSLRAPFFEVLEADEETLKDFIPQISLEDWAVACMNISKSQRATIDKHFNERQKFRFVEFLKKFDKMVLGAEPVGEVRRIIATQFRTFKTQSSLRMQTEPKTNDRPAKLSEAA